MQSRMNWSVKYGDNTISMTVFPDKLGATDEENAELLKQLKKNVDIANPQAKTVSTTIYSKYGILS